jgi:hypothetical protein
MAMMLRLQRRTFDYEPVLYLNKRQAEALGRLAGRMREPKCPYTDPVLVAAWTRGMLLTREGFRS